MQVFNQNIVVFEDDTFELEFLVDTDTLNSFDATWFGISTAPGSTYILQKANNNFDWGLFIGNIQASITQGITDGTPTGGTPIVTSPTTNNNGGGAVLNLSIDGFGHLTTTGGGANVSFGGTNYEVGDTLTVPSSVTGASNDLIFTLTANNLPAASYIPPFTNDIYINAYQDFYSPVVITVPFTQADFDADGGVLETGTTYYWELVAGKTAEYDTDNGYLLKSQVAATGTMYVSSSMFSIAGYRP